MVEQLISTLQPPVLLFQLMNTTCNQCNHWCAETADLKTHMHRNHNKLADKLTRISLTATNSLLVGVFILTASANTRSQMHTSEKN